MFKKTITSAALVAAATALAGAYTTPDTSSWTSVSLDRDYVSDTATSLSSLGMTETYDSASYSWCVSFTVLVTDTTNTNGQEIAYTASNGVYVLVNMSNGRFNLATSSSTHISDPDNPTFTPYDADDPSTSTTQDFMLLWDSTEGVLSLTNNGTTVTFGPTSTDHSNLFNYVDLTGDFTFRPNSGATEISNISISVCETPDVPEPSMFGLLAGLGAIGLVATRRRRNRKA